MRFWLQAEEISSKVTYKFFANNKELSGADVRDTLLLQNEKDRKDGKCTVWLQGEQLQCLTAPYCLECWFVAT